MNGYVMNMETHKLELHFEKKDYLALPEDLKKEINNNFLFSGKSNAWVSRAKFPNLRRAEEVAKKLGLTDGGKMGERLSFEEQMERKAKRAQEWPERCELKSDQAAERGKALQKPTEDMGGDPAFFTQPLINSSAGKAFANERNRMFAAWDKGLEEFKKSEYYARKAETARRTAQGTMPTDKAFLDRKIKETERIIRAQRQYLEKNREQVKQELLKGLALEELFEFQPGQGCDIYKGEFSLSDEIIYIPDLDLNEIPVHEAVEKEKVDLAVNAMYSGLDFLEQCGGKEELVKEFSYYPDEPFIITTNLSLEKLQNPADLDHDAFMTVLWRDALLLPFRGKITGRVKAGQTWRVLQAY